MPKRRIHFIGFLANADHSIVKLKLGRGFVIEKGAQEQVTPFLRSIDFYHGIDSRARMTGYHCVAKQRVAEFEGTPQGGVVIKMAEVEKFIHALRDKIRLLRLFKEGNILLRFWFFYHMRNSEPSIFSMGSEEPLADRTKFRLEDDEISKAQAFIRNTKIPFCQSFLQLAFKAFELSYEVHDPALAFLSLMIGLETMLNPGDSELRYRVSRNAAVLLGRSFKESEHIFNDVKVLYKKRSELVHTGQRQKLKQEDLLQLRRYVRAAIKEINTTGKSKDKLLAALNSSGFGKRP